MSLLQNARKCFVNQNLHESLNAFVTATQDGIWVQQHGLKPEEADARRAGGDFFN